MAFRCGYPLVTGELRAQKASNAEFFSPWCHYENHISGWEISLDNFVAAKNINGVKYTRYISAYYMYMRLWWWKLALCFRDTWLCLIYFWLPDPDLPRVKGVSFSRMWPWSCLIYVWALTLRVAECKYKCRIFKWLPHSDAIWRHRSGSNSDAWWHNSITWSNVDLPSMEFYGLHIAPPPLLWYHIYVQVQWFCHLMRSLMMCKLYTGLPSAINL